MFEGGCHCGAVAVRFESTLALADLRLARCACRFCRSHGARTVTDPSGQVEIRARSGALRVYRFGLETVDVLVCANCGVYVAMLLREGEAAWVTLNANTLACSDALDPAPPLVDYSGESREARVARRPTKWTPARVINDA